MVDEQISLGKQQSRCVLTAVCPGLSLQDGGEEARAIIPIIVGRLEPNSMQRSAKKTSYPKSSRIFSKQLLFTYSKSKTQ